MALQNSKTKYNQWWSAWFEKNIIKIWWRNPSDKRKFYPLRFINSVINEFQKGKECGDVNFINFEIAKSFIFVEIPYCELNEIKPRHFLKKFHKITSNSFRMIIRWKTRNKRSLFLLKDKTITNRVLSIKEIVLVVHVTLVKPNVMRKLDGMNIIIQLKVQNHQNTFKATSTTISHGLSFEIL